MKTPTIRSSLPAPTKRDPDYRKPGFRTERLVVIAALLFFGIAATVRAQEAHPTESQVKAAYLYNFGKFVTWQDEQVANAPSIEICVLGRDPFGSILDSTVAGESIDGRKITVERPSTIQEAAPCGILFISSSEEIRLSAILASAQHFGALTVSDISHFAERGGAIGFVMQQDRIRFEVNRSAAEQSHLVLSSELLKVASRVIERDPPQK